MDQKVIYFSKPILSEYLNNEFVIDLSCGAFHLLVARCMPWDWNKQGKIGDGCNDNQLIPIKAKGFNNERIIMI